ncbi:hypothetical protein HQ563_04820 [bacterium]|nr:hypothetical protein [bacterium]
MNTRLSLSIIAAISCVLVQRQDVYSSLFLNPYPMSDPSFVDDVAMPPTANDDPKALLALTGTRASRPYVRVGYVIPSNRSEQPRGVETIRYLIVTYQNWLRDQMRRHGQGPKTFVYETEPDGATPRVHVVHVADTDSYLREDIWGRTLSAVSNAGLALWQRGEVWLLVVEAHVQEPDGDVVGGVALGGSWGSGDDPGVAMLGGDALAMLRPEFITDDRPYHNTVLPEIGPYLLKQDVSFAWFEGETFSSVHSSWLGAGMHELGHAFGLPHDFRNDSNFRGNLMGNGFRGFRGCTHPRRYPGDFARLSHAAALVFGASRYFNAGSEDATRPTLGVSTQGVVPLADGLLPIQFSASDDTGLGTALLMWEDDVVSELTLSGKSALDQFTTEYFEAQAPKNYTVMVFDLNGNKVSQKVTITASGKSNPAPRPFLRVTPPVMLRGESFVLDASSSTDANHPAASLRVEWDLDGDGVFDTSPTTTKTLTVARDVAGPVPIRARITDETGDSTVSTAIFIDPHEPLLRTDGSTGSLIMEWNSAFGFTYQVQQSGTLQTWSSKHLPLLYGNGGVQQYPPPSGQAVIRFFRLEVGKRQD